MLKDLDKCHELNAGKQSTKDLEALQYKIVEGKIKPDMAWYKRNIISLEIPQLQHATKSWKNVKVNKAIANQTIALFEELEVLKLNELILTYGGSYNPRYVRGSTSTLSNHSLGLALDINVAWNKLGTQPTKAGVAGSVIPLIPTFNKYGFLWGGTFKRLDGMHFEARYIV